MANNGALNDGEINATSSDEDLNLDNISFNNYGLQNSNIITEGEGFGLRDYPDRRIDLINVPQGDGQILNDVFFSGRNISISGYLIADNKTELDDLIDNFKLHLSFKNGILKHRINGILRQIYATVDNIEFGTKDNIYISFTINFKSQSAFWSRNTQQSLLIEGLTDNNRIEDIYNAGQISKPLFILGFNSASNTNTISIKVDGIGVDINHTIIDGDILTINSKIGIVKLNGNQIDYNNITPIFQSGYNNTSIDINGDINVDINIIYDYNYL